MAMLPLAGAIVYVVLVVGLTLYIDAPVAFAIGFAVPGAALVYHIVQDAAVKRKRASSIVLFLGFLVLTTTGMAYLYSGVR